MATYLKPQWFQILLALADRDLHGLGIREEVLKQTDGRIHLWPAMLYGSLKTMSKQGLIEEQDGPDLPGLERDRRRYYAITASGRRLLRAEAERLAGYVRMAESKNPS